MALRINGHNSVLTAHYPVITMLIENVVVYFVLGPDITALVDWAETDKAPVYFLTFCWLTGQKLIKH